MKRLFAFVAFSLVLSGCGGGGSRTVPATQPAVQPAGHGQAPVMPSALSKVPASRSFARPVLPSALKELQIPDLTPATRTMLLAQRVPQGAARTTQGRSAGFFANEVFVGNDASGFATYWMADFGFYTYGSKTQGTIAFPGFLYKYNFAWLYDFGPTSAGGSDAYFFDFGAPDGDIGVFYTAPSYGSDSNNMYLYDFLLGHQMMYQENSSGPRWFFDFVANAWLKGNLPQTEAVGGANAFVRPDHRTLYYLDVDTASSQMCTAGCLSAWPAMAPIPNSSATTDLTMIQRSDGTSKQWTYQGHPLYTFTGDGNAADGTSGDGVPDFGGHWHIARPAGTVVPPQPTDPPCNFYC